jgi:hypothetical protein
VGQEVDIYIWQVVQKMQQCKRFLAAAAAAVAFEVLRSHGNSIQSALSGAQQGLSQPLAVHQQTLLFTCISLPAAAATVGWSAA